MTPEGCRQRAEHLHKLAHTEELARRWGECRTLEYMGDLYQALADLAAEVNRRTSLCGLEVVRDILRCRDGVKGCKG